MDPDELTTLRAQIAAATAGVLTATATATATAAQDKIEAEEAHNFIAADLATANILIAQLTAKRTANTVPTVPTFCLAPGQMSPDLILNYSTKSGITIYEKAITPLKLIFDGAISNIKILMDDIMQRANDTRLYKGQREIIHVAVDENQ